ncbi:hypothetical protein LYNGBM3L_38900 [Moorena producens 3L]|uniref:Uncharacterized protein n=1 Tax=Moorena producens 3L TaxID=489825 RepID=F4XVA3_9CYAN|nr:hypothetical protein LYNGBM3L_38900 [Moorena producens 3L]
MRRGIYPYAIADILKEIKNLGNGNEKPSQINKTNTQINNGRNWKANPQIMRSKDSFLELVLLIVIA